MTAAMVLSLTVYAIVTKTDFTICIGFLWVIGGVSLTFLVFFFIFPFQMKMIYCVFGVILFGLYLIIDTQMIVGGKRRL